ncbi:hypothetical protein THAOC_07327, partial [Thalassiosira oceanica]
MLRALFCFRCRCLSSKRFSATSSHRVLVLVVSFRSSPPKFRQGGINTAVPGYGTGGQTEEERPSFRDGLDGPNPASRPPPPGGRLPPRLPRASLRAVPSAGRRGEDTDDTDEDAVPRPRRRSPPYRWRRGAGRRVEGPVPQRQDGDAREGPGGGAPGPRGPRRVRDPQLGLQAGVSGRVDETDDGWRAARRSLRTARRRREGFGTGRPRVRGRTHGARATVRRA